MSALGQKREFLRLSDVVFTPRKRTFISASGMSAKGHKRTLHPLSARCSLLDEPGAKTLKLVVGY
jgi:hypothetical protein